MGSRPALPLSWLMEYTRQLAIVSHSTDGASTAPAVVDTCKKMQTPPWSSRVAFKVYCTRRVVESVFG